MVAQSQEVHWLANKSILNQERIHYHKASPKEIKAIEVIAFLWSSAVAPVQDHEENYKAKGKLWLMEANLLLFSTGTTYENKSTP